MDKETKEVKLYIILQLILVLLISVVFAYIFLVAKNSTGKVFTQIASEKNVEVIENKNSKEEKNAEETTNFPIVSDNNDYSYTGRIKNNRFYYKQLNENAKLIYDAIEENIENLKSGQYTINLSNQVAEILKTEGGNEILNENFQSAWDAIGLDRVDLFFIDVSKVNMIVSKTSFATKVTYKLSMQPATAEGYLSNEIFGRNEVDSMTSELEQKRAEIGATLVGSDYDKIIKAHDWIVSNVEYDSSLSNKNIYNLYGALILKKAVCEGYAEAFKYLMDYAGIECVLVTGQATNSAGSTENHEWNYVKLNGIWYGIDCTWDDPIITGNGKVTNQIRYKYFLKGSKTLNKNHYPNGQITSQGMKFVYPELSENNYVNGIF